MSTTYGPWAGRPRPTPLRLWEAAEGKKRVGEQLVLRTGRAKSKARDNAHGVDREEQVNAFVPPQPMAPADMRQPRQPAGAPAFGIAGRNTGAVQGCIWPWLRRQELDDMEGRTGRE